MDRRKFLIDSCTVCIGTAISGMLLSGCSAPGNLYKTSVENGQMQIPLTEFAENKYCIIRSMSLSHDVFAYKKSETVYMAVLMKCTHRDAPIHYTSGGLVCNEHGSKFSYEGAVIKEPATEKLKSFPVTTNSTHLIINLKQL